MYEYDGGYSQWYFQDLQNKKDASADANFNKIAGYVLKYGGGALDILTRNGIIKNKNVQTVLNGQYDQAAFAQLLAANGGSLNVPPAQLQDRSAKILGMDTSTLVLIAAAIVIALILKGNK